MLKMPTIVGILTFMSRINFVLGWVEHEKSFIGMEPGVCALLSFSIITLRKKELVSLCVCVCVCVCVCSRTFLFLGLTLQLSKNQRTGTF